VRAIEVRTNKRAGAAMGIRHCLRNAAHRRKQPYCWEDIIDIMKDLEGVEAFFSIVRLREQQAHGKLQT
jgi:hypothetical protein